MSNPSTADISRWRKWLVETLYPTYVIVIFGLPLVTIYFSFRQLPSGWPSTLLVLFSPVIYAIGFMAIAGILSRPHHQGIIPGRFPRDSGHVIYGHRKLYGVCWTSLYYFKPVYWICLTFPFLRCVVFRLFGYRGNLDFAIYPDTWIRDLPLLEFGKGSYMANRATLGSNIPMTDGTILVGPIKVGVKSLLGHLSVLGPGNEIGDASEIGPRCVFGVNVRVGNRTQIAAASGIAHNTSVGNEAAIGYWVYIGMRVRVADGLSIPSGCMVFDRTKLRTKHDVANACVFLKTSPE